MGGSSRINPGDKVAIVAPAGKGSEENINLILAYVESLELVPVISENIYSPSEPFYSNTDEFRANDLIKSLLDDEIKAIWCIRGGTGCIRLLSYLDAQLPESGLRQKLLIGFSDITVLHLYLKQKYDWETLHAAMLESIVNGFYDPTGESIQLLQDLIFRRLEAIEMPVLTRLDERGGLEDGLQGKIVGGNLTLIEASIGTTWEVDTSGKILFLEDTGEAAYRLERSLDHFKQTKVLESVSAIIFGDFEPSDSQELVDYVLDRFVKSVAFPVFRVKGVGHAEINYALPLNTLADIRPIDPVLRTYSCIVLNVSEVNCKLVDASTPCRSCYPKK